MKRAPIYKVLTGAFAGIGILLALCLAAISCNKSGSKNGAAAYKQYSRVLKRADSLYNDGKKAESFRYVDSLLKKDRSMPAYGKYVCYTHATHYYKDLGEPYTAELYADSTLRALEQDKLNTQYPEDYTHALLDLAIILSAEQRYEQALDYFTKAKIFAAAHGSSCSMSDYSYNIGMTLFRQEKKDLAIRYFNEAFFAAQTCERKPWYRMQELLTNIGLCYTNMTKLDSSSFYYDSTLSFIDLHEDKFETRDMSATARALVYRNMGYDLATRKLNDSAVAMFRKCIRESPRSGNRGIIQGALANIAVIYMEAKRYPEMYTVMQDFDKSLIGGLNGHGRNYWQMLMMYYYNGTRQFEKAAGMTAKYYEMKDSLQTSAASLQTSNVEKDIKDKEQLYQISLLKKDNELKKLYLWITVSCSALFAVIILLVFFTYRRSRRKSAQIRKQNEELEQLNREKDKILGVVAHDLRNPIGVISYLSDLIIEGGEERPKKEEESLDMILSASKHSLALINELLELKTTRQAEVQQDQVDMVALAKECAEILQFRLKGKDQQLIIETGEEPVIVTGNSERLSRLLQNLLTNAIKFSHPGSTIRLKLQGKDANVLVLVTDEGIGIPAALQPGLFNMFSGSRRKGTGDEQSFGLGLSISQQIVDEHKGRIWFESEEQKGTTFFVELPATLYEPELLS